MRTTSPGQSALLLLDVIDVLNARGLPYAVIGAFASAFHGLVRASLDADAVISVQTAGDMESLCAGLRLGELDVQYHRGDQDDPVLGVINVQDRFYNRVDLLTGIRGMPEEVFRRAVEARFMGATVKISGLEDLIAMKIFAGSPKDIQDVIGMLRVSGGQVDKRLLQQLAGSYGPECAQRLRDLWPNVS